jgi:hypothetical protein
MRDLMVFLKTRVALCLLLLIGAATVSLAQNPVRTPTETVREFYKAMREKKFREAFGMSIYKPAIDGLSAQEFQELLPDFEKMAAAIPENVDLTGEQISGDLATVFVKVKEAEAKEQSEPLSLIKINGTWIIGDRDNEAIVKKAGKNFFFNARIDTHHTEVQTMMTRITLAQVVYSQQHSGQFANMSELITAGLIPKDLEGTESTGYRFQINKTADAKAWFATAEPALYGKTGRLSFFLDASGVRSGDTGGKPLVLK